MSAFSSPRYLTTGQAARIIGCAMRTILKWSDAGILKCVRLPTVGECDGLPVARDGDRRITPEDLTTFCSTYGLPMGPLFGEPLLLIAGLTVAENDPLWELDGVEVVTGGVIEIAARLPAPLRAHRLICGCEEGIGPALRLAALAPPSHAGSPLIVRAESAPGEDRFEFLAPPVDLAAIARHLIESAKTTLIPRAKSMRLNRQRTVRCIAAQKATGTAIRNGTAGH